MINISIYSMNTFLLVIQRKIIKLNYCKDKSSEFSKKFNNFKNEDIKIDIIRIS